MDIETNVLEEVWKGNIPIRINLSTHDIASHEIPPDYYALVSRFSYLPQLLEAVKAHFEPYTSTDFTLESIWFSYKSVPLKWHYPIGLLADMNTYISSGNLILNIPFEIEVHFHRYPSDTLLAYQGLKSIKIIYQNSLKESCSLLLGTSGPVMNLSRDQEETMWKCISQADFKTFKDIGHDFISIPKQDCRNIPAKIIYTRARNGFILQPFPANENLLIGDAVKKIAPDFDGKIVVQGIEVPYIAELYWVWKLMAHPDNFLYISLIS
jgi:autophagy-related protein 5